MISRTLLKDGPEAGADTLFAGRYRIERELGRGGMGVVLKAQDLRLKRPVALKFLGADLLRNPEAKERFIREAQAAAALDHPNICTIYEVDESEGRTFIVMGFLEGRTLKQRIAEGPVPWEEAVEITAQAADALAAAHAQSIIHRDIKPANIMITPAGQVKIMDFGLAKQAGTADLTRTTAILGTIAYMSPEQARGDKVDARTDIWSLGCSLFETLAGVNPFHRDRDSLMLYAIVHEEPPALESLLPGIPAGLRAIVDRCLRKASGERYPDGGQLAKDLKAVEKSEASADTLSGSRSAGPSVAVLPFADMSAEKDQAYLGEGIAEELIHTLSGIKEFRVVARTSAFALHTMNLDVPQIGRRLNVKAVLEGSVRKSGNRLRVTAQLINVEDGFHLWSERFDKDAADVFAIQDEISQAIVDHLKVTLGVGEDSLLKKRSTADPDAYNLYLKGLYFLARAHPESIQKALGFFGDALDRDPNFALAYTGQANAYYYLGNFNFAPQLEVYPKAKVSVRNALGLNPNLAEAHGAAANLAFWFDWDWKAAGESFDRALALKPGDAFFHGYYAFFLLNRRKFDECLKEIKRALSLDPLMPLFYGWSVALHAAAGRPEDALAEFDKAMEIDPNFALPYFHAGLAYARLRKWDKMVEMIEKGTKLAVYPGWGESMLALMHVAKGERAEAERVAREMIELKKTTNVSAASIAWALATIGDLDGAFLWMSRAEEERDSLMPFIHVYTEMNAPEMARDPRYAQLLRRMNLDP
jgi:serine/threonine protein kinase/Tfp pilus assembly protein PilF